MQSVNQEILDEILLSPSNETKENRFSAENQVEAGSCQTGKCMPGRCHS